MPFTARGCPRQKTRPKRNYRRHKGEISLVFILMPILSGYFKRTSGRQQIIFGMTYIATFIAAWTFPMTRSDSKPARIHNHASSSDANILLNTLHPVVTFWPRAGKERQHETVLHRLPVHMPELAVVATTWRLRDCVAQVKKHLTSLGTLPLLHFTNQ